jgi:uncharacterized membrane protein YphA (DoxX/SURF4 family)
MLAVRREAWAEQVPETLGRRPLRDVPGVIFLAFGLMKAFASTFPFLVGAPDLAVASGPEGFARMLTGLGVPFPLFNAWMVILMEVLCGVGLILSAWMPATVLLTRLCALPLAVDMLVALSVGVRQVRGNPVVLDGLPVMNQAWRLPLEVGLLAAMVYLLWRPVARELFHAPEAAPSLSR